MVDASDDAKPKAELVEDGDMLRFHDATQPDFASIAFVDGVRRVEAALYFSDGSVLARGIAGAHACGAVISDDNGCVFGEHDVQRLVIWGSGIKSPLPDVAGGWHWDVHSIKDERPEKPRDELQERMRLAEARLAEDLCRRGHLTIVDGPLRYIRGMDLPIVGYVKSHYQSLLSLEHHERIPSLAPGQRTSMFLLHGDRYACYARLAHSQTLSGPWGGIIRLETPQSCGQESAARVLSAITGALIPFAGIAFKDPRAPQNLQPVFALENRLRRLMGSAALATRAVRQSVSSIQPMSNPEEVA
jgi:hypothetical protein